MSQPVDTSWVTTAQDQAERHESPPPRPRVIPATARLDAKPRKQSRVQRLKQQRQAKAWQRRAGL